MFDELVVTGGEATISWAWHTAAVCRSWRIYKSRTRAQWSLVATVTRVDPYKLQQRPLLFNAPRKGGYWCWPVKAVTLTDKQITAALGPMEA
jgi:hypothetical protein